MIEEGIDCKYLSSNMHIVYLDANGNEIWNPEADSREIYKKIIFRECLNINHSKNNIVYMFNNSNYDSKFYVSGNFGCVLFERKKS